MSVELLGGNEPLDLRTVKSEPEQEAPETEATDTPTEPLESSDEPTETEDSPEASPEESGKDPEDKEEEKEEPEPTEAPEYFVGDMKVNVEVPKEVSEAFKELGLDEGKILGKLFSKDSDFTLDEADHKVLSDKYGAYVVDSMLKSFKSQNDSMVEKFKAEAKSQEETFQKNSKEYWNVVGGEEGIAKIEDYILSNYEAGQLEVYNSVMQSDDHKSQLFVLNQIKKQMELEDKLNNGDKQVKLVGDDSSSSKQSSPLDKGYLTAEEYQNIIDAGNDRYWKDKEYSKQVDRARTKGIQRGQ